ncbi:hypothetical protein Fmac_013232 [Flemingia macrophylla]|uniref:F-box/LRR-repeat protein 15-like leucin rich repeat domain-containing protein n=1 Tax=Flemingia macrophylla TaxID=520843 RepID=A0ABD1MSJ6_9FABA
MYCSVSQQNCCAMVPPTPPNPNPIPIPNPNSDVEIGFDSDIEALIANFFEEHPNPQLPDTTHKRPSDANDDAVSLKRGRITIATDAAIQNPIPPLSDQTQRNRPLFEIDFLSNALRHAQSDESQSQSESESDDEAFIPWYDYMRNRTMERFRRAAKESATRYARFSDGPGQSSLAVAPPEIGDSAGPFSVALKAIRERAAKKGWDAWVFKRGGEKKRTSVPSLQELCLGILADNADAMVSLEGVPDELRHKLCKLLCDSRKMNSRFLELLLSGSPTEIRLKDCSWLTEEQFAQSFQMCDTSRLEVLQLDQCGRCIPDYALLGTLKESPRWLSRLTSLSLSGACRLSDKGLQVLVSSAPQLRSINLSQCSLLTSASLDILANSLGSLLKELYLDDCLIIDAAQIVPALKKLEHLEVLSLAGIQTVSDEFIKEYIVASGHNMKELVLKDCEKLTDASIKVIAEHCPGLCALDLICLDKLTDLSIGYLANSCRTLRTLKLCRNPFSDEAIAAFLEITGGSLKELSLNNIKKVDHQTTLSLARHAKNLHTLDLSWCRNLTDNELGFIVDNCLSLRLLKLFGCSLVTDVFLHGHSNPEIQILGLKMSPLLQNLKVSDPLQGPLRYSSVSVDN